MPPCIAARRLLQPSYSTHRTPEPPFPLLLGSSAVLVRRGGQRHRGFPRKFCCSCGVVHRKLWPAEATLQSCWRRGRETPSLRGFRATRPYTRLGNHLAHTGVEPRHLTLGWIQILRTNLSGLGQRLVAASPCSNGSRLRPSSLLLLACTLSNPAFLGRGISAALGD